MTKVIIAGSRNFNDKEYLFKEVSEVLSTINDNIEIVSGHCRGADILGEQYAKEHNIPVRKFPVSQSDWQTFGKKAGYLRNKKMAEYASNESGILIAFPVGVSKGTRMMIDLAKRYGLDVYER